MLRERIVTALSALSLYGMRSVIDEVLAAGVRQRSTPDKILLDLLEVELAERKAKSIRYQMGLAKFPLNKDLDRFDFTASPVDEVHIRSLAEGRFLAEHGNVILVGGTGTGKTILRLPWGDRRSETAKKGVSSTLWIWLTGWNRKNLPIGAVSWPRASPDRIS